ncbi:winged helix DNA-binding protein [Mucilaginibacter sp. HC2]|uniref:MarR family winged helix-turn-helix transcriptional regulator n=1 Tax=Mucilaginibacter inviolabilis TaxID=2714892 RepID=UPI00140E42D5|nr:MarR family transcriptional regulator [Mucilaginibacter inviolabilis]NHA03726.1 winged helix DNA-binding protein [Mucilaginibacter inviolabilis]
MNFGEEFSLELKLANKSYHQYLSKFFGQSDIRQHYQIIIQLSRFGGRMTQKMLCRNLNIERSNMVPIIDTLQNNGYVTREMNNKDRRGKLVLLTEKGNKILESLETTFQHFEANIIQGLTWQEMYNCIRVLKVINMNLGDILSEDKLDLTTAM